MKRTALEMFAALVVMFSAAILAGKACEAFTKEHEREQAHGQDVTEAVTTLRDIGETMDECGRTAKACCDQFSGCVDDLKRCRDTLVTCEGIMRDVVRVADIHLPLPDAGAP